MALITAFLIGFSFAMAGIGTFKIELIRRTLQYGFRAGFMMTLGAAIVGLLLLALSFTGIYSLIDFEAYQKPILGITGLFFIFWGIKSIWKFRDFQILNGDEITQKSSFLRGLWLAAVSLAGILFYIVIAGPLVVASGTLIGGIIDSASLVAGVTTGNIFAVLTSKIGRGILGERIIKGISLIAGIGLILFGISLGYSAFFGIPEILQRTGSIVSSI